MVARVLIFGAGATFIAVSVTWTDQLDSSGEVVQPGLLTTLAAANWQWLLVGMIAVVSIFPIQAIRWRLLLRARHMKVGYWRTLRLTLIGTFFNFFLPGTTGGDLVKAYYAARDSERRADAVMSVIVDRLTGLFGLLVLSAIAGLFMLQETAVRMLTIVVWMTALASVVVVALYFSENLRQRLRIDNLVSRLPGQRWVRKIDEAAFAYRDHIGTVWLAVGISVIVQLLLVAGTALAGYAVGMQVPIGALLIVIPLVYLVGALPLTYQGFGVMEWLAMVLLLPTGLATVNQIVIMLLVARLYQASVGLIGGALMLRGDFSLRATLETPAAGRSTGSKT